MTGQMTKTGYLMEEGRGHVIQMGYLMEQAMGHVTQTAYLMLQGTEQSMMKKRYNCGNISTDCLYVDG